MFQQEATKRIARAARVLDSADIKVLFATSGPFSKAEVGPWPLDRKVENTLGISAVLIVRYKNMSCKWGLGNIACRLSAPENTEIDGLRPKTLEIN